MAACLCLLGALLLNAPFVSVAWAARGANCCADGMCSIAEHHHRQAPPKKHLAMDCGHEMSGMESCTMDCCHKSEKQLLTSAIFTLPASVSVPGLPLADSTVQTARAFEIIQQTEPLSPPPRS